jgi:hypothetical protein
MRALFCAALVVISCNRVSGLDGPRPDLARADLAAGDLAACAPAACPADFPDGQPCCSTLDCDYCAPLPQSCACRDGRWTCQEFSGQCPLPDLGR